MEPNLIVLSLAYEALGKASCLRPAQQRSQFISLTKAAAQPEAAHLSDATDLNGQPSLA